MSLHWWVRFLKERGAPFSPRPRVCREHDWGPAESDANGIEVTRCRRCPSWRGENLHAETMRLISIWEATDPGRPAA